MKKLLSFLFLIVLTLITAILITACGGDAKRCAACADADNNGVCDVCGNDVEAKEALSVPLFEDGVPTFNIILSEKLTDEAKAAVSKSIISMLENEHGVEVFTFMEGSENDDQIAVEVLVGSVASRGEKYLIDEHSLGKKGYAVKIVGTKVLINGGSDEALIDAINRFAEDILSTDDITNLKMTADMQIIEAQDNYRITALKVNGNDMRGYTIATDRANDYYETAALELQDKIYEKTGYWLHIVDLAEATDKSIVIKHADGVVGEESFKVSAKGSGLLIECGFDNLLEKATLQFLTSKIVSAKGEVDFKNTVYTQDISVVYYDDFGAKGDGRTDDFFAIREAHMFANECGQTVKASRNPKGKVYYIFDTREAVDGSVMIRHIPIRTNTDWQGVKFIIDDREIGSFSGGPNRELGTEYIFKVQADRDKTKYRITDKAILDEILAEGINPSTTHINLKVEGWDGPMLIIPTDSEHLIFRRKGTNYNSGEEMQEVIIIDKDGKVSDETPIMFEYTRLNFIDVYKFDPTGGVTVKNAIIETLDSNLPHPVTQSGGYAGSYKKRGIEVSRSYSTLENIEHIITGGFNLIERAEGLMGANTLGLFKAAYATNVTFKNCIIPGRLAYGNGSSYNLGGNYVNKFVLDGCVQSNFWVQANLETGEIIGSSEYSDGAYPSLSSVKINGKKIRMFWGISGTNFCKNMEFINSKLSRFDAHEGLYNGKIIGSEFNSTSITGKGEMIIEDSTWYQYEPDIPLLYLRRDYGYYWDGDISVKDTEAYLYDTTTVSPIFYVIHHEYHNWYFGYPTAIPNVTLDNLDVYGIENQALVTSGYEIYLLDLKAFSPKMHLENSSKKLFLAYEDSDGDGFIDEPIFDANRDGKVDKSDLIDLDGDGKVGNTSLSYTDRSGWILEEQSPGYDATLGVTHPSCVSNVNLTKPPSYIKIVNNDGADGAGGYTYIVPDTSGKGISDGGWNRAPGAPDTLGGFFGNTKFIYEDGAEDFFHGTNYVFQNTTKTFRFVKID